MNCVLILTSFIICIEVSQQPIIFIIAFKILKILNIHVLITEFFYFESHSKNVCFFPQKYKEVHNKLEYVHKKMLPDVHRRKWNIGDWTDETDHMLLILQSILNKQGEVL